MKPKRFLVFTGPCYYAGGGWKDFSGSADTLEEAMRIVAKDYECDEKIRCPEPEKHRSQAEWHNVVDLETGEIVDGANT